MTVTRSLLLALTLTATAPVVSAGIIDDLNSDADFLAFRNDTGFDKQFGGNVRWGNGAANGNWEYAVVDGSDAPVSTPGQTSWDDGVNTHSLVFEFSPGTATLTLGGIGSNTGSVPGAGIDTLLLRARDGSAPLTVLSNIAIDIGADGFIDYTLDSLVGDSDASYWGIHDADLSGGFILTADAAFAGPMDAGSDPMYQLKVGTSSPQIPEPRTLLLLLAGGLIATRFRRQGN